MEWEDTVISHKEAAAYCNSNNHDLGLRPDEVYPERWHREAQAEISFKLGVESERRKSKEWGYETRPC